VAVGRALAFDLDAQELADVSRPDGYLPARPGQCVGLRHKTDDDVSNLSAVAQHGQQRFGAQIQRERLLLELKLRPELGCPAPEIVGQSAPRATRL
jgi:hypothetical protein